METQEDNQSILQKYDITIDKDSPVLISSVGSEPDKTDADIYLFKSEIDKQKGYQKFVEEQISRGVLGPSLCLLKEFDVGYGTVDFLGLDEKGMIFLVEVKTNKDWRSKSDVVFQGMKYLKKPQTIHNGLFISEPEEKEPRFKEKIGKTLKDFFHFDDEKVIALAKDTSKNLEGKCINLIIVVDRVERLLLENAFDIWSRRMKSECRVVELTIVKIGSKESVYCRKFFSNSDWVSMINKSNRENPVSREKRLNELSPELRDIFNKVVDTIERDEPNLVFYWGTAETPYFSIYVKRPGGKRNTLGLEFYTKPHLYKKVTKIQPGSIWFTGTDSFINDIIQKHHLNVETREEKTDLQTWCSFQLTPKEILSLQSGKVVQLIKEYKDYFLSKSKYI